MEDGRGSTEQHQKETVRLDTLDANCQRAGVEMIDLLKTDVGGHELEELRGVLGMLSQRRIKLIQFVYDGCNIDARVLLKDFFDLFNCCGYRLIKIFPDQLRWIAHYDQRLENFQYQNWVAIHA